jgi:hypothetical protein
VGSIPAVGPNRLWMIVEDALYIGWDSPTVIPIVGLGPLCRADHSQSHDASLLCIRSGAKRIYAFNFSDMMVLPDRIELSTSPLPRECSTTELRQQASNRESAREGCVRRAILATSPSVAQATTAPPTSKTTDRVPDR